MISRDRDHSEGRGVGVNRRLEPFRKFIRLQKALFKVPKIRNIIFWIENGPPPLELFRKFIRFGAAVIYEPNTRSQI